MHECKFYIIKMKIQNENKKEKEKRRMKNKNKNKNKIMYWKRKFIRTIKSSFGFNTY